MNEEHNANDVAQTKRPANSIAVGCSIGDFDAHEKHVDLSRLPQPWVATHAHPTQDEAAAAAAAQAQPQRPAPAAASRGAARRGPALNGH